MLAILVACVALLSGAASAQAGTKDPVQALKAVLGPGEGVHFTETTTLLDGADERAERRRKGTFVFDAKGGVEALDVTTTGGEHGPERVIGFNHDIGGTGYQSGGLVGKWLKKGKTWWKDSHQLHLWHTELLGYDEQLVNPGEPATLAALLKNGRRSGDTVTGTITFKQLERVSRWAEHATHIRWDSDTRLGYTVTLTSSGLVSRVRSVFTFPDGVDELSGRTLHVDTRYDRWGGAVSIKVPDPRRTTSELCIEGHCNWRLPG
ncbi:unnamed protein product [[Actinomadura] parvosata subsp. kistnae]|uniref:Lipoprotein n=1 Tax=[Actinomadura] parvosata subsp. kistnae TaxID=1909395 RepID=A0A1U9ZU73_9ACTN|nr:hypothetical protein [Nonomuraea sp. ATCC 55076]AQZ61511.1 hypothetical protein BKM31_08505 [Nonomuraea sp. ATCC 55076]SPL98222.1 unnamed protein product [Actinomadura parvosata subsp. kistnae]